MNWSRCCVVFLMAGSWSLVACSEVAERPAAGAKVADPVPSLPVNDVPRFPAPVRPEPTVWFQPMDLTTSVRGTPIRVGVDNLGGPVATATLDDVGRNLTLRTWPELTNVPARANAVPYSGAADEDPRRSLVL